MHMGITMGMTSYPQTLVLLVNNPFNEYMWMEMNENIKYIMKSNQREKFVMTKLEEVVN